MALPSGIIPKTVTIGIASFFDGSLASGTATITAPVNVIHTPTNRPIFSSSMSQTFVDGTCSFTLAPTDATGLNRKDWTYKLNVQISGALVQPDPIYFTLPAAGPDTIDLDSLVTVPSSAGVPISVSVVTSVNGQTGDVTVAAGSSVSDSAVAALITPGGSATAAAIAADPALRAALVPRPSGGTDGQALVKSGTDVVWGTVAAGSAGALTPTATKTAAYTVAVGELAVMNAAGGATTLTLPTAPADKAQVGFRAVGATTATPLVVTRSGTDTIGDTGATSVTLPLSGEVTVYQYQAAGTRWLPVANVKPLAALDGRYAQSANNLSDLSSAATARTNLGLATVAATGAYADLTGKPTDTDLGQVAMVVVNAGANLTAVRPANAATVYWKLAGVDAGTNGANIINARPGDLYYVSPSTLGIVAGYTSLEAITGASRFNITESSPGASIPSNYKAFSLGGTALAPTRTYYAVVTPDATTTSNQTIIEGSPQRAQLSFNGGNIWSGYGGSTPVATSAANYASDRGQKVIVSARFSATDITVYRNGVQVAAATTSVATVDGTGEMRVGGRATGFEAWIGKIHAAYIFDTEHALATHNSAVNYLASSYGVTL